MTSSSKPSDPTSDGRTDGTDGQGLHTKDQNQNGSCHEPAGEGDVNTSNREDSTNLEERNGINNVAKVDVETSCGIGGCHPQFLQTFKTIGYFSGFYSLTGLVTSALGIYITSQITTLEKYFNLNSSLSGALLSSNDIGFFLTCLPLSHLARRLHIPKALGIATICYGISGLLCTIPYFGTKDTFSAASLSLSNDSTSALSESPGQLCLKSGYITNITQNATSCDESSTSQGIHSVSRQWRALAILFIGIGMTLQGAAKSPRQTYVGVYIDDNVPKTKTTVYLGVIVAMSIMGPAIAFVLGGAFSSIYVTLEAVPLTDRDPRWVGAWWLGFAIFGVLGLLAGIPLLFFPRRMMVKQEIEKAEQKRKDKGQGQNKLFVELKGFLWVVGKLLVNPIFMLTTLGNALTSMAVMGSLGFLPKYLEFHFNQPSFKVNIIVGALNVGPATIGSIIGGLITSRFKMTPFACLKLLLGFSVLALLCNGVGFLIQCEQTKLIPGLGGNTGSRNVSVCASSCHCDQASYSYFPVCGDDGNNYFSPCHAGCTESLDTGTIFSNCSCLASANFTQAKSGLCEGGCETKFWIYTFLSLVAILVMAFSAMPSLIVAMRSVSEAQKPMAFGIGAFLTTLLGSFPGPVVFGTVIDTTCLLARTSKCDPDTKGACLLYDFDSFRIDYFGLIACLRVAQLLLLICAWIYARRSPTTAFRDHKDEEIVEVKMESE